MSDIPPKTSLPPETPPPKEVTMSDVPPAPPPPDVPPPPKPSGEGLTPAGKAALRGDLDTQLQQLEVLRAQQAHDLHKDLEKFDNRPKPGFYDKDPLHDETSEQINQAGADVDQHAEQAINQLAALDSDWAPVIDSLNEYRTTDNKRIEPYTQMQTLNDFQYPPRVETITDPTDVYYRYYGGAAEKRGRWLTKERLSDVTQRGDRLSLESGNTAESEAKFTIEPGTKVLSGTVKPQFGHHGGGSQVWVPDENLLCEVKP